VSRGKQSALSIQLEHLAIGTWHLVVTGCAGLSPLPGLFFFVVANPRLAPWALFLRRSAADGLNADG